MVDWLAYLGGRSITRRSCGRRNGMSAGGGCVCLRCQEMVAWMRTHVLTVYQLGRFLWASLHPGGWVGVGWLFEDADLLSRAWRVSILGNCLNGRATKDSWL